MPVPSLPLLAASSPSATPAASPARSPASRAPRPGAVPMTPTTESKYYSSITFPLASMPGCGSPAVFYKAEMKARGIDSDDESAGGEGAAAGGESSRSGAKSGHTTGRSMYSEKSPLRGFVVPAVHWRPERLALKTPRELDEELDEEEEAEAAGRGKGPALDNADFKGPSAHIPGKPDLQDAVIDRMDRAPPPEPSPEKMKLKKQPSAKSVLDAQSAHHWPAPDEGNRPPTAGPGEDEDPIEPYDASDDRWRSGGARDVMGELDGATSIEFPPPGNRKGRDADAESRKSLEESMTGKLAYLNAVMHGGRAIPRPVRRLIKHLTSKTVDVSHRAIDAEAAEAIAECIAINGCITDLNLSDNVIGDAGGVAICRGLASNHMIERLNLGHNDMGRKTAGLLADVVANSTCIRDLNLSANRLGDRFANGLMDRLTLQSPLNSLDLSRNHLTPAAAPALANILEHAQLRELDVSWNELGRSAGLLLDTLCLEYPKLMTLNLSFNGLQDAHLAEPLKRMLTGNHSVTELDLSRNRLSAGTAATLSEQLPANNTLRSLAIGFNPFGYDATNDIVKAALEVNTCLEELLIENTMGDGPEGDEQIQNVWEMAFKLKLKRPTEAFTALEFPAQLRKLRRAGAPTRGTTAPAMSPHEFDAPPWTLETGVFAMRPKECDSQDFYDTHKLLDLAFESDWELTKVPRVIKDENQDWQVREVVREHYVALREAFRIYSASTHDPFSMTFTQWTEFRKDLGIDDTTKQADLDNVFVSTNYEPERDAANPDRAFMRFELLEAIVRAALIQFPSHPKDENGKVRSVINMFEMIIPKLHHILAMADTKDIVSNRFRAERLYTAEVDAQLVLGTEKLLELFARYSGKTFKPGDKKKFMSLDEWMKMQHDAHLYNARYTERTARSIFLLSNMSVVDEHGRAKNLIRKDHCNVLTYLEFLEALCRLCDTHAGETARPGTERAVATTFGTLAIEGEVDTMGEALAALLEEREGDPGAAAAVTTFEPVPISEAPVVAEGATAGAPAEEEDEEEDMEAIADATPGRRAAHYTDTHCFRWGCGNPDLCVRLKEPLESKITNMIELLLHPAELEGSGSDAGSRVSTPSRASTPGVMSRASSARTKRSGPAGMKRLGSAKSLGSSRPGSPAPMMSPGTPFGGVPDPGTPAGGAGNAFTFEDSGGSGDEA